MLLAHSKEALKILFLARVMLRFFCKLLGLLIFFTASQPKISVLPVIVINEHSLTLELHLTNVSFVFEIGVSITDKFD